MFNKYTFEKLFINVPFIFLYHAANVIFFISFWPAGIKLLFTLSPSSLPDIQLVSTVQIYETEFTVSEFFPPLLAKLFAHKSSLLKTLAQYSYLDWSSHTSGCALVTLDNYEMHFNQQCYEVSQQLSKSPNKLQFVFTYSEIFPFFSFLLANCFSKKIQLKQNVCNCLQPKPAVTSLECVSAGQWLPYILYF